MNLRIPVIDVSESSPYYSRSVRQRGPMKLCNETITVFNTRFNPDTDKDEYIPTVIVGVSWYCEVVSVVDEGLTAANRYTIRIPERADTGGKEYVKPENYTKQEDVSGVFTLANGDIIVKGATNETGLRPKDLHARYEAFTVLGVTDNRRAPKAPHWRIVGS